MTDRPDSVEDRNVATHILKTHRRGEVKLLNAPEKVPEVDTEEVLRESAGLVPAMERDFLRKYVAYSKRITPVMSDEAMRTLGGYYVSIRKLGEGEEASVPITARQLGAPLRMSEASARARLNPLVTAD